MRPTTFGDLLAAAFDKATHFTVDLGGMSLPVSQAVARLLRRAGSRSRFTDAARGCRFPAYGTPVPVGAQIHGAAYAASSRNPAQVVPSRRFISSWPVS